jgi:KaiC/GvpD/RAD55 family RecA-like ATPase
MLKEKMESTPKQDSKWGPRVPTCVTAFDSIVMGGLPAGSLVLLLGDVGAGQREFAFTSAAKLAIAKNFPRRRERIIDPSYKGLVIPKGCQYISFSKSREEILREAAISYNRDLYEGFKLNLTFRDLSKSYFRHSLVPSNWTATEESSLFDDGGQKDILEEMVNSLDESGGRSLIIVDSLTDLFTNNSIAPDQVIYLLKGLKRISKKWDGLVYLILTKGVIPPDLERNIEDIADGVLIFEWQRSKMYSKLRRYLYVGKFIGVLPHIHDAQISRFNIDVNARSGLIVANTEKIY